MTEDRAYIIRMALRNIKLSISDNMNEQLKPWFDDIEKAIEDEQKEINAVLDKIRNEIEQMRAKPDNMVKLIGDFISIDYVLGVINKYMEDKNER